MVKSLKKTLCKSLNIIKIEKKLRNKNVFLFIINSMVKSLKKENANITKTILLNEQNLHY